MEHTPYPNRPSVSQRQDKRIIFLTLVEEIKILKLGPCTTICDLALMIELMRILKENLL